MNGNKFTEGSIVAYVNISFFAIEFKVLRNSGNYSTGKNAAVFSNTSALHNSNIAANPGSFTNFHILVNNGKRINLHILCYLGVRMYICMRMNHALPLTGWLIFLLCYFKKMPFAQKRTAAKVKLII